jgi:antitoxin (DNA-binding transcriptional repressor) of toxin-antitoxin stability system
MIRLNIHEAKTHLSQYLDRLLAGEIILLCRRNVPIAEIRALPRLPDGERPLGLAVGEFEVTDAFYEPLPDTVLDDFESQAP